MLSKISMLLLIISALISCSSNDDVVITELGKNRQLWISSQIENYSMNERISCFCAGLLEWDVFVENGEKVSVEFDETNLPPDQTSQDVLDNARTIEDAFALIEGLTTQNVASLVVEYNETYGFPTLISVDFDLNIADDEIAYIYSNFIITN